MTTERIIQAGLKHSKHWSSQSELENIGYASDYAEPGYDSPDNGIYFSNWNDRSEYIDGRRIVIDDTMPRVAKLLEHIGASIEWSDEWTTCADCGRAVRTSPDGHGWKQQWAMIDECEIVCADCLAEDPVDFLEKLEGKDTTALTFDTIDPAAHDYILISDEFESGWYPGQNDSPEKIGVLLRAAHITRYLWRIDSTGQFDVNYSLYVHASELSDTVTIAAIQDLF